MEDKPKTTIYGALKERGKKVLKTTKHLAKQFVLAVDEEAQNFDECAILTDIDKLTLKCDDVQAFLHIRPQYLLARNFDVVFRIENAQNKTIVFLAHFTQEEFMVQRLDGKSLFSVVFSDDENPTSNDVQTIGKIKHAIYDVQIYRILQSFLRNGRLGRFVIRKINDRDDSSKSLVNVTVERPSLFKIAKWLGFVMDDRIFKCFEGESCVAKIRPKFGWNARNLGYCIQYLESYKNYTVKTICLAFALMMFRNYCHLE